MAGTSGEIDRGKRKILFIAVFHLNAVHYYDDPNEPPNEDIDKQEHAAAAPAR